MRLKTATTGACRKIIFLNLPPLKKIHRGVPNMKRLRLNIITTIFVLGITMAGIFSSPAPLFADTITFTDLPKENPFYPYVNYLVTKDLVKGYPDNTFRLKGEITRAEVAALLVKATGMTDANDDTPTFQDVGADHWAYQAIEAATGAGLVRGYPDGTFRPRNPVTRAEMATLLLHLTKSALPEVPLPDTIQDVASTHWAQRQIAAALDAGLLEMADNVRFNPDVPATRGQTAKGLVMMLNISPERVKVPLTGKLHPVEGELYLQSPGGEYQKIVGDVTCTEGYSVKTGSKSRAEIRFPDGSGLKIEPNTEFAITKASGQSTVLQDGSPGAVVDYLNIDLKKGKIFGALATGYIFRQEEAKSENQRVSLKPGGGALVASTSKQITAEYLLAQTGAPWWKEPYQSKVRVQVNMPWGVAGIRGTFWMNAVLPGNQTTSVIDGSVEVTAGGQTVSVGAGQSTSLTSPAAPPPPPAPMSPAEQNAWLAASQWVQQQASIIESMKPVVTPPAPMQNQQAPQSPGPLPTVPGITNQIMNSLNQSTSGASTNNSGNSNGGNHSNPWLKIESRDPENITGIPLDQVFTIIFNKQIQPGTLFHQIRVVEIVNDEEIPLNIDINIVNGNKLIIGPAPQS